MSLRFGKILASRMLDFEIELMGAAVLAAIVFPQLMAAPIILGVLYMFFRLLVTRKFSTYTGVDLPVFLLSLILPISLWASPLKQESMLQAGRLAVGIFFFYSTLNWLKRTGRISWAMMGIYGGVSILAALGPFVVNWLDSKSILFSPTIYARLPHVISEFIHPNVYAGLLVLLLVVSVAWILFDGGEISKRTAILLWAICAAGGGVLLLTQSRGAILALFGALCVLALLRWRCAWIVALALGLAVVAGIFVFGNPQSVVTILFFAPTGADGLNGRAEIWSRALYIIQDFPFTGIGLGNYGPVVDALYPLFFALPGETPHAHNLFLQIAVDLGIPGLIVWLAIFLNLTVMAWQVFSARRSKALTAVGAGLLACQVAIAFHGLFDAVIWGMVRTAPLIWGLWGIIAGAWHLTRQSDSQKYT